MGVVCACSVNDFKVFDDLLETGNVLGRGLQVPRVDLQTAHVLETTGPSEPRRWGMNEADLVWFL